MWREDWNLSLQVSFNFFKIKPVSSMWFEISKLRNKTNIYRHRKDPPFKRSSVMSDKVSQEGPRHGQCTVLAQLLSNSSHSWLSFLSWHFPVSMSFFCIIHGGPFCDLDFWCLSVVNAYQVVCKSKWYIKPLATSPFSFDSPYPFGCLATLTFLKHWSSILCITVIVLNYLCDWCQ